MHALPSQAMLPLSLPPSLSHSCLHFRSLFSLSFRNFYGFESSPSLYRKCANAPLLVKNCTSITAKPSSELNRKRSQSEPDEKLRTLRKLFTKPGINIDAYIVPSQDAHQVWILISCLVVCESILLVQLLCFVFIYAILFRGTSDVWFIGFGAIIRVWMTIS